jgi:hypothetical protein
MILHLNPFIPIFYPHPRAESAPTSGPTIAGQAQSIEEDQGEARWPDEM